MSTFSDSMPNLYTRDIEAAVPVERIRVAAPASPASM